MARSAESAGSTAFGGALGAEPSVHVLACMHSAHHDRSLSASLHAELPEQAGHIVLDRLLGEEEAFADLAVRQSFADQVEDPPLLYGQRRQRILGSPAR